MYVMHDAPWFTECDANTMMPFSAFEDEREITGTNENNGM